MNEPWYVKATIEYRKDRYMDHLSEKDLFQRAKDIILNCIKINRNGKISFDTSDDYGQFFWVRFSHIVEEYNIRYGDFRKKFDEQNVHGLEIPKNFQLIDKVCEQINRFDSNENIPILYKYGKLTYLNDYLENGKLRISPASSYNDSSLNHAMKDDELNFTSQIHPSKLRMELLDKDGNFKSNIKPLERKLVFKSTTDFYVFCLSRIFSPRLFVDFDNADGCLVIKDVAKFIKRFTESFYKNNDNFFGLLDNAKYVDPLFTTIQEYDLYFSKHFRYAYQREFRICFVPQKDIKQLKTIELQLGCLNDCCELIKI